MTSENDDATDATDDLGISFFGANDELVSTAVWNMFTRWQNSRGFSCRSTKSINASQWVAQQRAATPQWEASMKKRGELQVTVRDGYRAFESKYGRAPTARELFEALGEVVVSVKNVGNALWQLRAKGEIGAGPRATATAPKLKTTTTPTRPRILVDEAHRPSRSTDPTVAALAAKRDELRRKADALDVAIEALS